MGFNYNKWSLIIGSAIALCTIAATITVPEVRCGIGLEQCTSEDELVDIIVKQENLRPLQGVKVYFASKGAPEVVETDSNGYAQIKIPSRGDVKVDLLKDDYQPITFMINLKNNKDNTRTVTLKKLQVQSDSSRATINPPSTPSQTSPKNKGLTAPPTSLESSRADCTLVSGSNWRNYTKDISIGRIPYPTRQRLYSPQQEITCKILENTGIIKYVYAIPDNSKLQQARVVFYVDGSKVKTIDVKRGSITPVTIDVSKAKSFAVDIESNRRDSLYSLPWEVIQ